ncbi:MAG: hypothetical protein LBS57_00060, partial [Treponema sp.]|nr:hypothetical protein [Treponema sp.]
KKPRPCQATAPAVWRFFYSGFWQSTTDEEETRIWYRADKLQASFVRVCSCGLCEVRGNFMGKMRIAGC